MNTSQPPTPRKPDIDLYRLILARITAAVSDPGLPPLTLEDNLAALHLVCIAVSRLNGLWRTNARLYGDGNKSLFAALRRLGFTDEQLQSEVFLKNKSTRGAQIGNTNALKYGLYTRLLAPAAAQLDENQATTIEDELALVRVMLLRLAMSLKDQPPAEFRKYIRAFNLINHALQVIQRLERSKALAFTLPDTSFMDSYLEEVNRILSAHGSPARE